MILQNDENINNPKDLEDRDLEDSGISPSTVEITERIQQGQLKALPVMTVSCPRCDTSFEKNCENLEQMVICSHCGCNFMYVDGYLNYFKAFIELFIDKIHPIPLVPGYTTGGNTTVYPDDLTVVEFGITYRKTPQVFFLLHGGRAAKECLIGNQVILPLSIGTSNFIIFSRSLDTKHPSKPVTVKWQAIGEFGDYEKPLWLNYLQNSADLVRHDEEVAAVVMLLIALDFYYDHILDRLGIDYEVIRRHGRRAGMNEKKAKLELIEQHLGAWPASIDQHLRDITDYRNRIVHRVVNRPEVQSFSSRRAFQIVMRGVLFLIEMYYRKPKGKDDL